MQEKWSSLLAMVRMMLIISRRMREGEEEADFPSQFDRIDRYKEHVISHITCRKIRTFLVILFAERIRLRFNSSFTSFHTIVISERNTLLSLSACLFAYFLNVFLRLPLLEGIFYHSFAIKMNN